MNGTETGVRPLLKSRSTKPAMVALVWVLVLASACGAFAVSSRDPLSKVEIDQLRDAAQEPEKRLPLYVKFIKARASILEQLRNDPRLDSDRGSRIHDLLEDIDVLIQEMDDNIGIYAHRRLDMRKPLKDVIEMNGELQGKLREMKQAAGGQQSSSYTFALDNALDSASGSLSNAQQVLQEQEEVVRNAKKKNDATKKQGASPVAKP